MFKRVENVILLFSFNVLFYLYLVFNLIWAPIGTTLTFFVLFLWSLFLTRRSEQGFQSVSLLKLDWAESKSVFHKIEKIRKCWTVYNWGLTVGKKCECRCTNSSGDLFFLLNYCMEMVVSISTNALYKIFFWVKYMTSSTNRLDHAIGINS